MTEHDPSLDELTETPFFPRGIGADWVQGCFVCDAPVGLSANISGFVRSKEDGELVVRMFGSGAYLDWRPHEPGWIQVKFGACPAHEENLRCLYRSTSVRQTISPALIDAARSTLPTSDDDFPQADRATA